MSTKKLQIIGSIGGGISGDYAYFDEDASVTEGTPTPLDADTFGGVLPSGYVKKEELAATVNNISSELTNLETEVTENYVLKNEIDKLSNSAQIDLEGAENAGETVLSNADLLAGMTYQQIVDNSENQTKSNADTSIIPNSANLVTSGAVYNAICNKVPQSIQLNGGATTSEPGNTNYVISNGLCYVNFAGITVTSNLAGFAINLPKALVRCNHILRIGDTYPIVYIDQGATSMNVTQPITDMYFHMVYPIAE